jgi:hypothetical protein
MKKADERLSGTMADIQEAAKRLPTDVVVLYSRIFCRVPRLGAHFWTRVKSFNNSHGNGSIRLDRFVPAISKEA